jgi:hypothetical protein
MILTNQAKKDLLEILQKEVGLVWAENFTDEDLNKIGVLLLNVLAENLKIKAVDEVLSKL